MRQFLLGKNVAYATAVDFSTIADGAIGVYYNKDGAVTSTSTGADVKGKGVIVLGRPSLKGGPVVIPVHTNNFSFVKGDYQPATTFEATVAISAPAQVGDYSLIVAKKGVLFNMRNKWTGMVHVKDVSMKAEVLAQKLVDSINGNIGSGVKATLSGTTITIKAEVAGVDYSVIGADLLFDQAVTVVSKGLKAYGSAEYITDLANKAAADAGYEYTYRDAYVDLYPSYPLNPLAQPNSADAGFTVFTLRFAEPRDVKTRDEVVNQIVQIALPTGAAAIDTLTAVFSGMAGETAAAAAVATDEVEGE